ncbi:hypothetical protein DW1_0845 [Proteiniborus sp. DW1]|uniref:hypothetical protein n=1 Tax=Proteiniborus sp. DW1 TaxID=1889883 RepID=UPI00092E161A|nr:hypothetical protein [Proteiniborus sp. DW1]SCG82453.1 hypothetical protein DW1_0845 [Proteiniborus sp. DW1]
MDKKFKVTLLLAIILAFSLGLSGVVFAEVPFEVKTSIGFNGFYKYEYVTPINIEVKNNVKDLNGKIQVLFENTASSDKKLYTAYTKDIDIAEGTTKTINMEFKLDRHIGEYKVRILDENDKVIWENKPIAFPSAKASNTVGVGILSDEYESLGYLPLMVFSNPEDSSGKRATVMCDLSEQLPTDTRFLEMLNVIIINNYNTEKLTTEEKNALNQWINNGGVLLIGTGPSYNKTLKGLEDFNYINVTGTSTITEFKNMKDSSGDPFTPNSPLQIINATSDTGNVILEEEKRPIIFAKSSGKGKIIISVFDLGLSPFLDWSGKDKFIQSILAGDISGVYTGNNIRSHNYPYKFHSINQYIPTDKAPSVKVIITILMIFTIIAGPINYLVLRILDKREMAWITIPALSIIFSLVMLIWGSGTSFKNPLMNNVSVISINNELNSYDISTHSGVISFKNGDVNISSSENTAIFPNISYGYNDYMNFNNEDIVLEYILQKNNTISFKDRGVWDIQQITLKETKKLEQNIIQDLKLKEDIISGEIKNNTNMDLEDAFLFYSYGFHKLGDIKSGESKSISFSFNTLNSSNKSGAMQKDLYPLLDSIYPWNSNPTVVNNQKTTLTEDIKRRILEDYLVYNDDFINNGLYLIAWNTDNLSSDITVNGKVVERIDRNIITMKIDLKYEKGDLVEIPYGILSPLVLEMTGLDYQPYERSFFGQGDVVMSVKSDEKIDFKEININLTYARLSSGNKVWLYNYDNNQWDEVTGFNIVIDRNNKDNYYDEVQGAKLKISLDGNDHMWMPKFSVKGVAK